MPAERANLVIRIVSSAAVTACPRHVVFPRVGGLGARGETERKCRGFGEERKKGISMAF